MLLLYPYTCILQLTRVTGYVTVIRPQLTGYQILKPFHPYYRKVIPVSNVIGSVFKFHLTTSSSDSCLKWSPCVFSFAHSSLRIIQVEKDLPLSPTKSPTAAQQHSFAIRIYPCTNA